MSITSYGENEKKGMTTREIAITAMGIALFVVLSLCLQVPIYQNYYLCLGYFVMAVWLYSFGVLKGTIVGTLGVILYCILTGGLRGMPGWTVGNFVIGIIVGFNFKFTKSLREICKNKVSGIWINVSAVLFTVIDAFVIVFATTLGILIAKSFIEHLLYAQPMLVRITTNSTANIADIVTLIVALPLVLYMDKVLHRFFPNFVKKNDKAVKC